MTEEENKLWYQYLSSYPVRFIRQKIISNFILDFYCSRCRLGIELDRSQRLTEDGLMHDAARTGILNAYGVTPLSAKPIQGGMPPTGGKGDAKRARMILAR